MCQRIISVNFAPFDDGIPIDFVRELFIICERTVPIRLDKYEHVLLFGTNFINLFD